MNRYFVKDEEFVLPERYRVSRFLQSGAYGMVVQGFDEIEFHEVAIKKCIQCLLPKKNPETTRMCLKRMLREIEILSYFSEHPCENIVKLYDVFNVGCDVYLVFELMTCDLRDLMKSESTMDRRTVKVIAYQILLGILVFHRNNLLHRDLKPRNILFNAATQTVTLCDFGLSRFFEGFYGDNNNTEGGAVNLMSTHNLATRWYRSPELLLGCLEVTPPGAIDIWAFGCVLSELLRVGHHPLFPGRNRVNQLTKIIKILGSQEEEDLFGCEKGKLWITTSFSNKKKKDFRNIIFRRGSRKKKIIQDDEIEEEEEELIIIDHEFENEACDLISRCLEFNITKRISAEDAIRHSFFREIHDESDLQCASGEISNNNNNNNNNKRQMKFETSFRHDMSSEEIKKAIIEIIGKFNPKAINFENLEILNDNIIIG